MNSADYTETNVTTAPPNFDSAVDLAFRLIGESVPIDHGYALYSAVATALPELHNTRWLGIHPIDGKPAGRGTLSLHRNSTLKLRVAAERIPGLLRLAGKTLIVRTSVLRLGPPTVLPLVPAASVDARCVHVRLTEAPRIDNPELGRRTLSMAAVKEATLRELERQLLGHRVSGRIELCGRRTVSIAEQRLVGFSIRVSGLNADDSLRLQTSGLGGKRSMGCGLFRPTRGFRGD